MQVLLVLIVVGLRVGQGTVRGKEKDSKEKLKVGKIKRIEGKRKDRSIVRIRVVSAKEGTAL